MGEVFEGYGWRWWGRGALNREMSSIVRWEKRVTCHVNNDSNSISVNDDFMPNGYLKRGDDLLQLRGL